MTKSKSILFAAAAFLVVPAFASAQNYYGYNPDTECQQSVNNAQTAGGLGGAIAGAAIGSNLAAKGVKKEGAVLGAVLGAVVGSSVGKNRIACDDKYQYQQNQNYGQTYQDGYSYNGYSYNDYSGNGYNQYNYGNQNNYNNQYYSGYSGTYSYYPSNQGQYKGKKKGHHHHHWDSVSYPNSWNMQGNCGYGQAAYRLPNGKIAYQQVYMCRKPNGEWAVVD